MPAELFAVRIKYTGPLPWMEMGKRQWNNEVVKPAMQAAGEWWHAERLPLHFSREGYREYGFTRRSGDTGTQYKKFRETYTGRKLGKYGHTDPNVWTGESKRSALQMRDVRATFKRVRIYIHAPRLNWKNPKSTVQPSDEVRRVNFRDLVGATRVINRSIEARLGRIRVNTIRRIA